MTRALPTAEQIVHVNGLAHDGRGVARHDGKAVFVAGALPGEDVSVRTVRARSRLDEASLVSVLKPSPDRVSPACPHAGDCGGCNLQHLSAPAQLLNQQQRLADTLERIGRVKPRHWMAPVPSEPWHYRSRARLSVSRDRQSGVVLLGFREEGSTRIEPVEACPVLVPALSALPARIRDVFQALRGPVIPEEVWLAAGDADIAIAFCTRGELSLQDKGSLIALGNSLGAETGFGRITPVQERIWESPAPRLHYSPEPGLRLGFAPWDFTQANRAVNETLVSRLLDALAPSGGDGVLDFFCGLGNFSLPLARRAGHVLGIEGSAPQVESARANARANGINNCDFRATDLFRPQALHGIAPKDFRLAVLDPPRAGAALLCERLHSLGVQRIAYVSCDAATLARDARTLTGKGFRLESAGVFQMFPHTSHAESLALFVR